MANALIFASSCDLHERLPIMIAEFLDIKQKLQPRFREHSVTDILIASLLSLPGDGVVVLTPSEPKTGGDFYLVVVDPLSGDTVQFRILANRLTPQSRQSSLEVILFVREAQQQLPTEPPFAMLRPHAETGYSLTRQIATAAGPVAAWRLSGTRLHVTDGEYNR